MLKFVVGSFRLDTFLEGRILDPFYDIKATFQSVIWGFAIGCLRLKIYNEYELPDEWSWKERAIKAYGRVKEHSELDGSE
jgi:hypothetical protein